MKISLFLKNKKGFTLIELLVVVAIISLLSSIVMASLNSARMKARDVRRISDLRQIRNALELYRSKNGVYPSGSWSLSCNGNWDNLQTQLSEFIPVLPKDPINTNASSCASPSGGPYTTGVSYYTYGYNQVPGGNDYDLVALLENTPSLTCAVKKYGFHYYESSAPNNIWCVTGVFTAFNDKLYADH